MNNINDKDFESIMPTAYACLQPLLKSDIPLVKETIDFLQSKNIDCQAKIEAERSFFLESRYKLINYLLNKENCNQFFEIASGFLMRGSELSKNKDNVYVEMDLPPMAKLKKEFAAPYQSSNWHIIGGNALRPYDFCDEYFDKNKKIAVISQGILLYLTAEEKDIVANNVKQLLQEHGGVWASSDFTCKSFLNTKQVKEMNAITPRHHFPLFETQEQIINYLDKHGLKIKFHSHAEACDLGLMTLPKAHKINIKTAREYLKDTTVGIVRLK